MIQASHEFVKIEHTLFFSFHSKSDWLHDSPHQLDLEPGFDLFGSSRLMLEQGGRDLEENFKMISDREIDAYNLEQ